LKTQAFKLGEENPHYFGNVPSKKRWHYPSNFDNILFVVTKKVTSLNCIVVTYEIRVFFKGAQKEVFSSILKFENVNT
jgi:hypothetical protein